MYIFVSRILNANFFFISLPYTAEPVIVLAPENETLKVGDEIQLQCEAEGVPTPTITWHKDGVPIEATNRIYFGEQNIELHIEHSVESDTGMKTFLNYSYSNIPKYIYRCFFISI